MIDEKKRAIGKAISDHISRQGLSRENYCIKYGFSYSTMCKMITGRFTDKSLSRLESKVGISFDKAHIAYDRAANDLGAYLHSDFRHYEGKYTLIRRSFETSDRICLFPVLIDWDDAKPGLRISGQTPGGYNKIAHLAFPKGSPYLFIHANEKGWLSLMIFGTLDVNDFMKGALLTAGALEGGVYAPFFLPILLRSDRGSSKKMREIESADADFAYLKERLESVVLQKFVRTFSDGSR